MNDRLRADYIDATRERRAPSPSSLSSKSVRDCRLAAHGKARHRIPAPVAVVSGRAVVTTSRGTTRTDGPSRRLARQGNGKQGLNYGRKARI